MVSNPRNDVTLSHNNVEGSPGQTETQFRWCILKSTHFLAAFLSFPIPPIFITHFVAAFSCMASTIYKSREAFTFIYCRATGPHSILCNLTRQSSGCVLLGVSIPPPGHPLIGALARQTAVKEKDFASWLAQDHYHLSDLLKSPFILITK